MATGDNSSDMFLLKAIRNALLLEIAAVVTVVFVWRQFFHS